MQKIKAPVQTEIVVKKSRFLTFLIHVTNENEAKKALADLKKKYPLASHYTYCYILGLNQETAKSSDDGEPAGTAGNVIYEALKSLNITSCLGVTIRFFGGIKLGASNLKHTYRLSLKEALKICEFTEVGLFTKFHIVLSYKNYSIFKKYYKDSIISEDMGTEVTLTVKFKNEESNRIVLKLIDSFNNQIKITELENLEIL